MKRHIIHAVALALFAVGSSTAATNESHFIACVDNAITNLHYVPSCVWGHSSTRVKEPALDAGVVRDGLSRLAAAGVLPTQKGMILWGFDAARFGDYGLSLASAMSGEYPLIAEYAKSRIAAGDKVLTVYGFFNAFRDTDRIGEAVGEILSVQADGDCTVRDYSDVIKRVCTRQVKVHLRSKGRSFVTRDGVNPLEPYAKRLETILNAPRMEGLEAFLTEIGLPKTYAIPQNRFMSDAEVKDTCEKILVDDLKLTSCHLACRLRCAMGTDAYNAFVKEYNEGTTK